MKDNDLINIKISRIISAEKDRVFRLLTKVWEFPSYIATVKEVKLLSREHNKMKTKWRVQVDSIPISWVEEDVLDLNENTISFRALEGDLSEYNGRWALEEHSEGTIVTVDINLKIDIPAIKDFAGAYLKKMITKNFEAILEAVEKRLISIKYSGFKQGSAEEKVAGFGILGHFYNMKHLEKCLKMLNPDFKMPSREFLLSLFTMTPSFKVYGMKEFKSAAGDMTYGTFILCTFVPEMISQDMHGVYSKVVRACKIAEKSGVGVVALGGLTSMVGEKLGHQIAEEVDIPITTGNTFTAALVIDGVEKAAGILGRELKNLNTAIIGGTGDIGSACARALCRKVKHLTVTGRTKSNMRAVKDELRRKYNAKIDASFDNEKAVKKADIVIAAASASSSILKIDWFKPGAVICDLGYPKNISYAPKTRKDIFVFSGGLSCLPTPIDIGLDLGLPDSNVAYGCFSEVIILALEHRFENYSYGRGNITLEKIDEMRGLGKKHGFNLAPFFWADGLITEEDIEIIKKAAKDA